jgi:hypothetical protein
MSAMLTYLLMSWGAVTAGMMALIIYGNTLSVHEDDQLFLSREEQVMMGADQRMLVPKKHNLALVIVGFGIVSGALAAASAAVWIWKGLFGS